ncbi:MAG TPA: chloride channel protein [Steroidobacteraceae bacterium]|nr:chloride channel protein [Steroidobacteraceae bacterium]
MREIVYGAEPSLAVRRSATAADLPNARFASQQETYPNVRGDGGAAGICPRAGGAVCFAPLMSDSSPLRRLGARISTIVTRLRTGLDPMVPLLLLGALVGFVSAVAVEGFRTAMWGIMSLYTREEHLVPAAAHLPLWERALIPPLAALAGGTVMWAAQRWIKRPRGPEYMEAVRVGEGRLPLVPNLVRTVSSLFAVSGGITIGREGTMIQFAALISSLIGRAGRATVEHQRLVVACGAAAGFAAAYHAPIAGTLFVAEIILGGLQLREIAAVLVAAVIGELTTQSLFAIGPLYLAQRVPPITFIDLLDAGLLGVLAGLLGPMFLWLLDASRRAYQARVNWLPLRMGIAGVVIGLLSVLRPEVWGNGYSVVQSFLVDHWVLSSVGAVFVLRLLAVTAASAAGIPGGVLTPTLALGAAMGLMVSHLFLIPEASHSQALWTLVGMGSLLAATTHAPAMSAIMVFEMTRNYNVVMAAMPACVLASVVGSVLRHRSVYAEALGLKEEAAAAPVAATVVASAAETVTRPRGG